MSSSPDVASRAGRPAVVLLSGGLDSATCLALAGADGYACHALAFRYGQRHAVELDAAAAVADAAGVELVVVDIDLRTFGGSALTADIEVPKHADVAELDPGAGGIPVTYVPARNTIFLSFALAFAEVRGARDIFIGVNALDYSGYPDCRPAFIEAFEHLANVATRSAVEPDDAAGPDTAIRIHAPLIAMTKAQIITRGTELGVDYARTTSCYDPVLTGPRPGPPPGPRPGPPPGPGGGDHRGWVACGRCDSCLLRRKGFADAGLADPIEYLAP